MADRRVTLVAVIASLLPVAVPALDKKVLPPPRRSFASPSGRFELQLRSAQAASDPHVVAEMFRLDTAGRHSLWSRPLPQRLGPALALVSDEGSTLLVDEWVRTPSPYALMVLGPGGETVGTHSMADIAAVSGLPMAELVARARSGPWMSDAPSRSAEPQRVSLHAGGVQLLIDLGTARLARADAPP